MLAKEHQCLTVLFYRKLFQVLAGGSRYPEGNIRIWYCFCCFVREREVNERASSDTGEAGFNEMRVQFPGYGAIDEASQREMRREFNYQATEP